MRLIIAGVCLLAVVNYWLPEDIVTNLAGTSNPGNDSLGRPIGLRVLIASVHSLWRGLVTGLLVSAITLYLASFAWERQSRFMDSLASTIASVPLIIYLVFASALFYGGGWIVLCIATAIFGWPERYLQLQSDVRRIRELPYCVSAIAFGLSPRSVFWHKVIPNSSVAKSLLATTTAEYLILFGALSVVGISAGESVDLGRVIFEYLQRTPFLSVYPLSALGLLILFVRWVSGFQRDMRS